MRRILLTAVFASRLPSYSDFQFPCHFYAVDVPTRTATIIADPDLSLTMWLGDALVQVLQGRGPIASITIGGVHDALLLPEDGLLLARGLLLSGEQG